jgi:S1-C subfamily serine protease
MLKHLLTPLVLLAHLLAYQGTPYEQMVSKVQRSVVKIEVKGSVLHDGDGSCSGEVVAQSRVLTAAHCAGEALMIDNQVARIIDIDEYQDLMVLDAHLARPALKLRKEPVEKFEPLTAIGYAWGWTEMTVLKVFPFLIHFTPDANEMAPGIFVQTQYIGGMSGGPVVDEYGEQVGIVQQGNQGIGYGVGADAIADFLAHALTEN